MCHAQPCQKNFPRQEQQRKNYSNACIASHSIHGRKEKIRDKESNVLQSSIGILFYNFRWYGAKSLCVTASRSENRYRNVLLYDAFLVINIPIFMSVFGACLSQHFQGLINHGRSFTIYRTFHNVVLGASAQLHCFLLELESLRLKEGKLPDTIYYQIDGGIENVAKTVMLVMELIVARRLTKTVYLTRLMVGHTHEDIDARYTDIQL